MGAGYDVGFYELLPIAYATMALTLGDAAIAGTATASAPAPSAGAMALTLAAITLAGTGTATTAAASSAAATIQLAALALAGAGTAGAAGTSSATGSIALAALTLAGTGTADVAPPSSATGTVALAAAACAGAATAAVPGGVLGAASIQLAALTLAGTGTAAAAAPSSAAAAITLAGLSLAGSAHALDAGAITASAGLVLDSIAFVGAATATGTGGTSLPPTLRQAIYSRLSTSSSLVGLVGSRIYFGALPQTAARPALVYSVPSRPYGHHLGGADGTSTARVQFNAIAWSEREADQISQAIRQSWDGYRGTIGGVEVLSSISQGDVDLPQPPRAGTDRWTYEIACDYSIKHRVSYPAL